ncbi:MAG: nucleotidyltransferase family protein [Flavobacterium sp.]
MLTKEQILTTLEKHSNDIKKFGVNEIGLFGSYVRNEQTSESDIDLLIHYQNNEMDFFKLISLEEYLESILNRKLDLVTKNGLSEFIGPYILKEVQYAKI